MEEKPLKDPRPLPNSSRPLASFLLCGPQAKSLGRHVSGKSSEPDIRNLWTTATLSQPKLNVPLPSVPEVSELEGSSLSGKTHGWYKQKKASHYSDSSWKETDDKDSFKPEQDVHRRSSLRSHIEEGDDDINTKAVDFCPLGYRSGIGWDHFLTKQLQRYIERLKRRQNKRLHVSVH
ncbi:Cation channel sperm-associated protein subunit zeta [Camelus dromedarius]|uniref:Cation channel sperm-associated protein subunit zeta n=1 Tax=Camelus dromedarius TaxID=9838 RepID=A0A5N4BYB7_CAMDR|nr:Cation channel sperm-associated protein subunit zeta [Camelus dromedarius]